MAKIEAVRSEQSDYEVKQPIRLTRGLYGGMFARYTLPKAYPKFQSSETEEKFFVSFVVTHDAAGRELPKRSDAFAAIRPKLFYSNKDGKMSTYTAFLAALTKFSPAEVADLGSDMIPDLDELIGYPARLLISPSLKPDKNGIYVNKIDTQAGGFDKPDDLLRRGIAPLFKAATMTYSEKTGLRYLASPIADFEEPGQASSGGASYGGFDDTELDDSIPF